MVDHLGEQHAEPFVGAGHAPSPVGGRLDGVLELRSAAAPGGGGGFDDQAGIDELGQVLADGVVSLSAM
jgi:hypothetical protein